MRFSHGWRKSSLNGRDNEAGVEFTNGGQPGVGMKAKEVP
jgi:hypothetical protein